MQLNPLWWVGEFGTALLAHLVGGKLEGAAGSLPQQVGRHAGRVLGPHILPSWDDEAAYVEAVSELLEREQQILMNRLIKLGIEEKKDTPEARAFRQVIVTLPDKEARVKVLRSLVKADEQTFLRMVEMTGAARAGQIDKFIQAAKALGISLPGIIRQADERAARNIASLREKVQGWFPRPKSELNDDDAPKPKRRRGWILSIILGPIVPDATPKPQKSNAPWKTIRDGEARPVDVIPENESSGFVPLFVSGDDESGCEIGPANED